MAIMTNFRIVAENFADSSVLSSNPALLAQTPVSNLNAISRSKVMRTNTESYAGTTQEILGNLLPTRDVSAIILGRHNFPEGTGIRIQLYSATNQDTMVYDSGVLTIDSTQAGSDIVPWGSFVFGSITWGQDNLSSEFEPKSNYAHWITTPITGVQSFKISIIVVGAEVEIGRLFIGDYIEPTYNISLGHKLSWVENTRQFRTDGGTLRSDIAIPFRRMEFNMSVIPESERSGLQASLRLVGLRRDFFICLFPDDPSIDKKIDYSGIMKLTKVPSMQEFASNYYKSKYIMEEV